MPIIVNFDYQVNPKIRPSFDNIVKALDIILDKMVDSDDDVLNSNNSNSSYEMPLDCVIEDSLICTCKYEAELFNEDVLGIKESTDRFGSVHKTGSRRLLKRHLQRCPSCGGRVWKLAVAEQDDRKSVEIEHSEVSEGKNLTPLQVLMEKEFSAGKLLNDSHEIFTEQLTQLVENTPGKLPRFFQNLLRSKRAKIRPREVKKRWRKSLHDIFSSQSAQSDRKTTNAVVDAANSGCSGEEDGLTGAKHVDSTGHVTGAGHVSSIDRKSNKGLIKAEKNRKISRSRKKSENKIQANADRAMHDADKAADAARKKECHPMQSETLTAQSETLLVQSETLTVQSEALTMQSETLPLQLTSEHSDEIDSASNLDSSAENCDDAVSPGISRNPFPLSLGHSVAVSIDSLDRLSLSDDHKRRRRRSSMPNRKSRHPRTQSSDATHPPLRKQSSGSNKLLNFLRRKSNTSPRD